MLPLRGCTAIRRRSWTGRPRWWDSGAALRGGSPWSVAGRTLRRGRSADGTDRRNRQCAWVSHRADHSSRKHRAISLWFRPISTQSFPPEHRSIPGATEKDGTDRLEAPGACDNGAGIAGLLAVAHALTQAKAELQCRCCSWAMWARRAKAICAGFATFMQAALGWPHRRAYRSRRRRSGLRCDPGAGEPPLPGHDHADPADTVLPMPARPTRLRHWPWRWLPRHEPPFPTSLGPL